VDEELVWCSIAQVAELFDSRSISPVELAEAYLSRIDRFQKELNAYVTVTPERALEDARRAEAELMAGHRRGPLHGIPIGLKDLIDTAGIRTTAGSRAFADRVPSADAVVAERLRVAGTVLLGKHATHEFAYGGTNENEWLGPTRNPWDRSRVPGGSSGGSAAAVVAGLAAVGIGTDTCGSIRIPAAFSGCVGVKPSYGAVSLTGVVPLAPTLDHVGPLARTVEDAAVMLGVLCEQFPPHGFVPPRYSSLAGVRIGVLRRYFCELIDDPVADCFEAALEVFGGLGALLGAADAQIPKDAGVQIFVACGAEAHAYHDEILRTRRAEIGAEVLSRMEIPLPGPEDLAAARAALDLIECGVDRAFSGFDVLVAPTEPIVAPRIGNKELVIGGEPVDFELAITRCTAPFNVAKVPVVSVPCGFALGMPAGLQVVARRGDETAALRVAAAYEQATQWHKARPALTSYGPA